VAFNARAICGRYTSLGSRVVEWPSGLWDLMRQANRAPTRLNLVWVGERSEASYTTHTSDKVVGSCSFIYLELQEVSESGVRMKVSWTIGQG
jgi:hypothetical protein